MKWITALAFGVVIGFALPLALGGVDGAWMQSFAKWGTVRPFANSPSLLFSIPLALGTAIALRSFFNWHTR